MDRNKMRNVVVKHFTTRENASGVRKNDFSITGNVRSIVMNYSTQKSKTTSVKRWSAHTPRLTIIIRSTAIVRRMAMTTTNIRCDDLPTWPRDRITLYTLLMNDQAASSSPASRFTSFQFPWRSFHNTVCRRTIRAFYQRRHPQTYHRNRVGRAIFHWPGSCKEARNVSRWWRVWHEPQARSAFRPRLKMLSHTNSSHLLFFVTLLIFITATIVISKMWINYVFKI